MRGGPFRDPVRRHRSRPRGARSAGDVARSATHEPHSKPRRGQPARRTPNQRTHSVARSANIRFSDKQVKDRIESSAAGDRPLEPPHIGLNRHA